MTDITAIVGVCREDDPHDVDEAYGAGTYARLFPDADEETDGAGAHAEEKPQDV